MKMSWKMPVRNDEPLYRQLQRLITDGLRAGHIQPGERLPSVVSLARQLKVSRETVVKAFHLLERGGVITSHVGKGTFVAQPPQSPPGPELPSVVESARELRRSYSRGLKEILSLPRRPGTLNLSAGIPLAETVEEGLLDKLSRRVLARNPRRLHDYGGPAGLPELRAAIARHLGQGITSDQVVVTNGSQQAILLLACWARSEGYPIFCETPTFTGIPAAFNLVGPTVESVPWGESAPHGKDALHYICPDFHNPTGQTLDEKARRSLAKAVQGTESVVVSDEIFRDLRFEGTAPPSLYSLLPPGRRVLVGSLSKTFMSGLRAGWLVAERPLIEDLMGYKRYMDLGSPALTQAIAAAFLEDGYDAHLKRMRPYYRERRNAALSALKATLPKGIEWTRPEGGFHLWVRLPEEISSIDLYLAGLEQGVSISPGPAHDIDGRFINCFRISYGHLTPREIHEAVQRLSETLRGLPKRALPEREPEWTIPV